MPNKPRKHVKIAIKSNTPLVRPRATDLPNSARRPILDPAELAHLSRAFKFKSFGKWRKKEEEEEEDGSGKGSNRHYFRQNIYVLPPPVDRGGGDCTRLRRRTEASGGSSPRVTESERDRPGVSVVTDRHLSLFSDLDQRARDLKIGRI